MATHAEYAAAVDQLKAHFKTSLFLSNQQIVTEFLNALKGIDEKFFDSIEISSTQDALVKTILDFNQFLVQITPHDSSALEAEVMSPQIAREARDSLYYNAGLMQDSGTKQITRLGKALSQVIDILPEQSSELSEDSDEQTRWMRELLSTQRNTRAVSISEEDSSAPAPLPPIKVSFLDQAISSFSPEEKKLYDEISHLATPLRLSHQSETSLIELVKHIEAHVRSGGLDSAQEIYDLFKAKIKAEDDSMLARVKENTIETTPLHLTPLSEKAQMHDKDMDRVMPKSSGTTDVLAGVNLAEPKAVTLCEEAIKSAMKNDKIQHLIIPVGPGHWRGVYLSKPNDDQGSYTLEIFDSFGEASARQIEKTIKKLLTNCEIRDLNIVFSVPPNTQRDAYSCGDYVCAHSHKKMKEFEPSVEVDDRLINALDVGNKDGTLRKVTRLVVEEKYTSPLPSKPLAPSLATTQPAPSFPTKEVFSAELKKYSITGWTLQLQANDPPGHQYTIQSIDQAGQHHRDRDVAVFPGKVSAVLNSDEHDVHYRTHLAKVMISAAVISGMSLEKIKVHCADKAMEEALLKEIDSRKAGLSAESEEVDRVILRPK